LKVKNKKLKTNPKQYPKTMVGDA